MLKKNQELCPSLSGNGLKSIDVDTKTTAWYSHPHLVFASFVLLLLIIRLALRGSTPEIDEAEQLVMARQLQPGYPFQPPLYTWLQYFVFQLLGYHLFSLAILKYTLLAGCLSSYYQLCRYYCHHAVLAWCAFLSWVLIVPISLDLLKDNTHSILALLLASLTWQWYFTTNPRQKTSWYAILGLLIGAGCLSKFNYLLFLAGLILTAATLPSQRHKLMNRRLGVTLALALVIIAPYGLWLWHHHALGLQSMYKLAPQQNSLLHGLFKYGLSLILFAGPVFLVSSLFFSVPKINRGQALTQPLYRYIQVIGVTLALIILLFGFKEFQPRWLIPILFMVPLLFFSQLDHHASWLVRGKRYIYFCLCIQGVLILTLIFRAHAGHQASRDHAFAALTQAISRHCPQPHYIYAGNPFLLGALSLHVVNAQIELQNGNEKPRLYQGGRGVLVWGPEASPFWIDHFKAMASTGNIIRSVNPVSGDVFAHFICLQG